MLFFHECINNVIFTSLFKGSIFRISSLVYKPCIQNLYHLTYHSTVCNLKGISASIIVSLDAHSVKIFHCISAFATSILNSAGKLRQS